MDVMLIVSPNITQLRPLTFLHSRWVRDVKKILSLRAKCWHALSFQLRFAFTFFRPRGGGSRGGQRGSGGGRSEAGGRSGSGMYSGSGGGGGGASQRGGMQGGPESRGGPAQAGSSQRGSFSSNRRS